MRAGRYPSQTSCVDTRPHARNRPRMSRTTIMIDSRLLHTAMRIHGFKTRREAVDFALRMLVEPPVMRKRRKTATRTDDSARRR